MIKDIKRIGVLVSAFIVGLTLFVGFFGNQAVAVNGLSSISGFAWSSNIGWISFNHRNCDRDNNGVLDEGVVGCLTGRDLNNRRDWDVRSTYGVKLNETSGDFSGYAWSSNAGWVYFGPESGDRTIADAPEEPKIWAKLDNSAKITGWARACSVFASGCSGQLKSPIQNGGWDGFIKLSGQNFAVSLNKFSTPPKFSGFAWGGGVENILNQNRSPQFPGWISFSGARYGVFVGDPDPGPLTISACEAEDGADVKEDQPASIKAIVEGGTDSGASGYSFVWSIASGVGTINSSVASNPVNVTFNDQGQGVLSVTVRAGSDVASQECFIPVKGTAPDFSVIAGPSVNASFLAGSISETNPDINISIDPENAFNSGVGLSFGGIVDSRGARVDGAGKPLAVVAQFSDEDLTVSGGQYQESTLKLRLTKNSDLRSGNYRIIIVGDGGGLTRQTSVGLNIDAPDIGFIEI